MRVGRSAGTEPVRRRPEPARRRRPAVVAIVVVGGLGFLALRGDDSTAPSASPHGRSATRQPRGRQSAEGGAASRKPSVGLRPPSRLRDRARRTRRRRRARRATLGDVGDLDVGREPRPAPSVDRASISASTPRPASQASDGAVARHAAPRTLACASELPDGTVVAIGTGRFGTRDAIVVETDACRRHHARSTPCVAHPCEVRPLD